MKQLLIFIIFACASFLLGSDYKNGYKTENYIIFILHPHPEGCVSCDNILFMVTDIEGNILKSMIGRTTHSMTKDGTPGRFLGYRAHDGNGIFYSLEDDIFSIISKSNDAPLVEERVLKFPWE